MTQHAPADTRRRQILDAARARFIADGFKAARVGDIARDAGLSKGGVYFHFDSKRAIFDALIESEFEDAIGLLRSAAKGDAPIAETFEALARHYLALFSEHRELLAFRVVAREMALRDTQLAELFARLHASYREAIRGLLARARSRGELAPGVDLDAAALLLKALMDGLENVFTLGLDVDLEAVLRTSLEVLLVNLTTTATQTAHAGRA